MGYSDLSEISDKSDAKGPPPYNMAQKNDPKVVFMKEQSEF